MNRVITNINQEIVEQRMNDLHKIVNEHKRKKEENKRIVKKDIFYYIKKIFC